MANCCEEPVAPFTPTLPIVGATLVVARLGTASAGNKATTRVAPTFPQVGAMTSQKCFNMIGLL